LRRPNYGEVAYNTEFCVVRDSDNDLFVHRLIRPYKTVKENALMLAQGENISKKFEVITTTFIFILKVICIKIIYFKIYYRKMKIFIII